MDSSATLRSGMGEGGSDLFMIMGLLTVACCLFSIVIASLPQPKHPRMKETAIATAIEEPKNATALYRRQVTEAMDPV